MEEVQTFCKALEQKYRSEKLLGDFQNITISPKRRASLLEMQGHALRRNLALDMCNISRAGEQNEIKQTCPLLAELDLSDNKLADWTEIFLIIQQLQHLTFLNISRNPLGDLGVPSGIEHSTLPSLQHLIVNNINFRFNTLLNLLKLFPCVTELHASLNSFDELPDGDVLSEQLKSLHFTNNNITSWQEVQKLGRYFPSLETLYVSDNKIQDLTNCENVAKYFPCLQKLSISRTLISKWTCLDQLRLFPRLIDVRMNKIPLWNKHVNEKERLQLLIARLPQITVFNGGKVSECEREDAERKFLRYYKYEVEKPKRFTELFEKYGHIDDLAVVNLEKRDHVMLSLFGDIENETVLKFPASISTNEFRKIISKKFKIPLSKFRLIIHDEDSPFGGTEMRIGSRTVLRYTQNYAVYHGMETEVKVELQRFDVDK